MLRIDWDDLPEASRNAIEMRTGAVLKAETAAEGLNSQVAVFLRTDSETIFVKGLRSDHPRAATQRREAMINPYVLPVGPRLLWQMEIDDWNFLAFEYFDGRHADYSPGSPDLPVVVKAMRQLAQLPCPDLPLKRAEHRLAECVDDRSALDLLRGDSLLHTDFNPFNILINGDTARIIDWAWPTRGAAWIDPAYFVLRLINAGHSPAQAELWAAQTPAWHTASDEALDIFALASSRLWDQIARDDPQPWKKRMSESARGWAHHRLKRSPVESRI
jgi:hypothetical protein